MEKKIEHMFADAINPVLDKLKDLKAQLAVPWIPSLGCHCSEAKWTSKEQSLVTEHEETDPHRSDAVVRTAHLASHHMDA